MITKFPNQRDKKLGFNANESLCFNFRRNINDNRHVVIVIILYLLTKNILHYLGDSRELRASDNELTIRYY